MVKTKFSSVNVMTQDKGRGLFTADPKNPSHAPAIEHRCLPVRVALDTGDSLQLGPENETVSVDAADAGGDVSVLLPQVKGQGIGGKIYRIKNRNGGQTVNLVAFGSGGTQEFIDGLTQQALVNTGDAIVVQAIDDQDETDEDNDTESGWIVIGCCMDIS